MREALIGRDLLLGCILVIGVSGSSPSLALLNTEKSRKENNNVQNPNQI